MTREEMLLIPPTGTFFNEPACTNIDKLSADVVFIGIPYEYGKLTDDPSTGQKYAPNAIRDQVLRYSYVDYGGWETHTQGKSAVGRFNINTGEEELKGVTMADCGNIPIRPSEGEQNFDRITKVLREILNRDAFPVVVGGDHTIPFPVLRAFDRYNPLDIVHFDAHVDYYDEWGGSRINATTSIRRCSELAFVRNITHIGLTRVRKEPYEAILKRGNKIITADQFRQIGANKVIESIPQAESIYVTIDIDVLNSFAAPGTSVYSPDGLSYLELRDTLIGLPTRGKIVGFDLVEVCPPIDGGNNMTSCTAAELILTFLGSIFRKI